ncbi:thiazole synthase [Arsukibacterium indicum]|uniref:Thiazole synthase n=1 Tax=Arsukibacterium indicum TaxID=2848612 RepID=A0ABS6MMC8_9GAMM|nr:thiazole synthase [Arsukibacterium indicum]MBV2129967.1 thiazole synthase [Arsukibacterium indicum]
MLQIADKTFNSRLLLGSGKFASSQLMQQAVKVSNCQLVTLAIKRLELNKPQDDLLTPLRNLNIKLLPNTAGAKTAKEAIFAAELARDALQTSWLKLEIHPDPRYLMPDPVETLLAAERLVKMGFVVLPYCSADPVLCKRLEQAGCAAVMPLGAAIGSNQGLQTRAMLEIIIEQAQVPVIIDAGLGAPSHAAAAMELGAAAVLVNTAIASSADPVAMAGAFANAVRAGRAAYLAGLASAQPQAVASSPFTDFLTTL